MVEAEQQISLREFLESVPPGSTSMIGDLGGTTYPANYKIPNGAYLQKPEIYLYCTSESCDGLRFFKSSNQITLPVGTSTLQFVTYTCKNCGGISKTFALWLKLDKNYTSGAIFKYGEVPQFGPPTPSRLTKLIGPQKELFLKGRRSENQGLGIAAFAYYRRVIEGQKDRIFDEIIKVCKRINIEQPVIDDLTAAKAETQFTKAVESVKHGIPPALLINGHNPLTLIHSALSEGLHAQTDEECLQVATSIRVVMADFAERMGQVLKDEAELNTAVSRLLGRKAVGKPSATALTTDGDS